MSSEAEPTPGPWVVHGNIRSIFRNQPKDTIAVSQQGGWISLAVAYEAATRPGEGAANARLIAAAPDLLAALKQIVADWESVDPNVQVPDEINTDEHWDAARAAIRKAEGE